MKKSILFISIFVLSQFTQAQDKKEALKFNLNEDGSQYFQVTFLNQTWLRYNQANTGSMVDGEQKSETFDIGLRRTRIQMFGEVAPKVFVYFQFGQNNFNAVYNSTGGNNRKNAAFLHDALCEYRISKSNQLKIGGGLTIANGLSRFSQPSIGSIASLDVPVLAQTTVDQIDQFARKLSLYARGQIGHWDYRFCLTDPFPITSSGISPAAPGIHSNFASIGRNKQIQAYLIHQFFEHESHTTPYMTGTHLGKKKIFNLAAGFIQQKNAMWNRQSPTDSIQFEDMSLFCVESYLDIPLNKEKGNAISAYLGYFNTNYGKNYLRYNGLMNPMNGSSLNAGNSIVGQGPTFGNAYPMFGTGEQIYAQFAYLFPENTLKKVGRIMPYTTFTYSKLDRLNGLNQFVYHLGMNLLLNGHRAKLSLDWQNRPEYSLDSNSELRMNSRRGQWVLQYQISI